MTTNYYRDAQAAILCYDITNAQSLKRARFWAREIHEHEPNCVIFICETKTDLMPTLDRHEITTIRDAANDLCEEFHAKGMFHISSKTGRGVEELFESVAQSCFQRWRMSTFSDSEASSIINLQEQNAGWKWCC